MPFKSLAWLVPSFVRQSLAPAPVVTGPTREQLVEMSETMRTVLPFSIRSDSFDESKRSVTAVAATDNPVLMFDWERWDFVDEILVADGGEFPERMPILDSHDRTSIFKVFGSAVGASKNGGDWEVQLEFDEDDDSLRAMRKVQKRHITDVSIGYDVLQATYIEPGESLDINGQTYTASPRRALKVSTKWKANEVSVTPIGADRAAKIRAAIALVGKPIQESRRADELAAELDDLILETGLPRDQVIDDMATAADMSESELNDVLSGDVAPNEQQLDGIAAALETDPAKLASLI